MQDEEYIEETGEEDAYVLDRRTVSGILDAVERGDAQALTLALEPLHAADIADLLEQIESDARQDLVRLYDREFDGEILSELAEEIGRAHV